MKLAEWQALCAERQALRREAYRIAILMIEPAIYGDATLVEENDLDPSLLKEELQRIFDHLQKRAGVPYSTLFDQGQLPAIKDKTL